MPGRALAKLTRPRLYGAVPRARLFQRLDELREHPAVWVCGPPGAGKTTLVASYVSERDIPGIWYQVDAGDGDPATFFYYLRLAAEEKTKGKRRALPLLTPEFQSTLDRFARRYFRELFAQQSEGALLVLDNVQEGLHESGLATVLESLVDEIPEGLNLVCISRSDPPAAFARYASTGRLAILEWSELRLTLEETRQIATVKQPIREQTLRQLFDQSEGWAAGVTLMLERIARTGDAPEAIEAETRETVFNFFAGTFFDRQPADTRQVLLRTAFLPQITPSSAESLTGNPNAGKVLEHLHRRHLFTYRKRLGSDIPASGKRGLKNEEPAYEYHALFRDFLEARVGEEYSTSGLRRLLEESAQLLETGGQDEEAFALFLRAEDWSALTRLLLKQAPTLLRQGRAQTLRERIAALPAEQAAAQPWIIYWHGVSLIPVDQVDAIRRLEIAFELFQRGQDKLGQIACAARVIDAIYRAYVNYEAIEHWIDVLDALLTEDLQFDDRDIELRAHCSLFQATFARRPQHPRLQASVDRIAGLLQLDLQPDEMVAAGDALLRYFDWGVNVANAQSVIAKVESVIEDRSVAPLEQLYWWTRVAFFYLHDGRTIEACTYLQKADQIAADFGSHIVTLLLDLVWTYKHLMQSEVGAARQRGERMLQEMPSAGDPGLLFIRWAQAMLAMQTESTERAMDAVHAQLETFTRVGPFFAHTHARIQLAALLARADRGQELDQLLDSIRKDVVGTYMGHIDAQLLLVQAESKLRDGEHDAARAFIERAVAQTAATDFLTLRLVPGLLPTVFGFALREEIGVARIKAWIERYGIAPDANAPQQWPWAIKLKVLGGLSIECLGKPVQFKKKAPKKPLELLTLLAAAGPEGLTDGAIADHLWPDLEADAAATNVDTNVYRLRKLLPVEDAIISGQGRVALNPQRCWVDAWSFERLATECRQATQTTLLGKANEALALYKGHFLNGEAGQSWALAFHDGLAQRLTELILAAGAVLEQTVSRDAAINLYQRGLSLDNLSEPMYRRLIINLNEKGDTAEALKVYRRCRELLSIVLNVQPSAETRKLVATLHE